ncbi:hypothetical protein K4A83_09700 [Spirulina subsalsa FACHB-351]|uniref:Uncharacterized protein n=1 Tax=Spirulina subsalsa FACHB-351 TaxID=234711 RepID=A0ABT3L4V5_9CYAN|nr:hypothetical protein [Spirulina subsalsa]MCW6036536.1 hypothetical protein [Spirulina subsalsa FACHB-351]
MNEYHPRHDADQAFKQSLEELKEILEPKKSVKPPPTPKESLSLADEALWEEAGEDLEVYFKEEDD